MSWDTADISLLSKKTSSNDRQKLINGMGTVSVLDPYVINGEEDPFLKSWRGRNSSFIERLNEINPIQLSEIGPPNFGEAGGGYYRVEQDYFTKRDPSIYSSYIYDSVMSLGIAACRARAKELAVEPKERRMTEEIMLDEKTGEGRELLVKWPNTGSPSTKDQLFKEFPYLEFEGASGSVVLHNKNLYNRNNDTVTFGVYNLRLEGGKPSNEDIGGPPRGFEPVLTSYTISNGQGGASWVDKEGVEFIYADRTATPPSKTSFEKDQTTMYVAIGFVCAFIVAGVLVVFYVRHKKRQADSVWSVMPSELKFHQPPEVIGQGTFGMVVLAEYRGTQVAVKRVLPVKKGGQGKYSAEFELLSSASVPDNFSVSNNGVNSTDTGVTVDRKLSQGSESGYDVEAGIKSGIISVDDTKKSFLSPLASQENKLQRKLRNDFIDEMRYLSKLRHPCITTVMGAVIDTKYEPMLIMEYMDHGSLHDLLHNETLVLDGDIVLPILRDIAQGLRFLHAASPQVIHVSLANCQLVFLLFAS